MTTAMYGEAGRRTARWSGRLARSARETVTPALFLLVPMAFLAVMVFWPLLKEIGLSFTDAQLTNPNAGTFVGLHNFTTLFSGPALPRVLINTVEYTVGTAVIALVTGILAALVVNTRFTGYRVVRAILAAPWAIPGVASALIWLWMFSQSSGVLDRILKAAGIPSVPWLTATPYGMISVVIVTAWQFAPFVMLVTLAALQSVPEDVAEASRIDGATSLSTFRFVVWPHILPTVRLVAILLTIWCLRRWDLISILTGGGPVNSTNTIVVAIQRQAFDYQEVGMGAAYAMVGIVIAVIFALGYLLLERNEQKKESR